MQTSHGPDAFTICNYAIDLRKSGYIEKFGYVFCIIANMF